jgi:hypothetical protein
MAAYEYEKSSKNNFNNHINSNSVKYKFTEDDKQLLQSLYMILSEIKSKDHEIYHKVCSFIRYPYQTVKNGFDFINITKDLSF